jgi:hypothetical protein
MPAIEVTAPRYQGEDVAWSGLMPAVEVTAPRHQGEDVAWSGLMPAVEVTAPRHENEDIAWSGMIPVVEVIAERVAELLVDETARHEPKHVQATLVDQVREPDCELDIQCADLKIFGVIPNAVTFSGDYSLPAGDTIDEDVTVTGGNALIDGVISGDLAVMGGTVDVNGTVTGDVAVFGGNLEMNGFIDGDAAVLGGNIRNKGTIDGDLHVIGGTVYLDSASAINGDVSMVGGTVERDENAVVLGKIESVEIKALEKVLPRISKAFRLPRMIPGAEAFPRIVFIGMLVVMFVLNIFVILIFPRATSNIAEKIQQSVWACVGIGIAFEILFVPIIVLLAVSIVGIPLIILLPLAVLLAILFGMTALSLIVGERVVTGFNWKVESQVGKFCLGWLAIMIIPIVVILIGPPVFVIGAVIFYIATTISLGSVLYTLMRRKKAAEAKK